MSEATPRPGASRGRGSGRGGRGGFASRGGRTGRTNGDKPDLKPEDSASAFDEGEVGELRKRYGPKIALIRDMFPDWSEVDILFALQETDGDENLAVTRMADGSMSQWGEVSKPKKATRVKSKEPAASTTADPSTGIKPTRGGRNVSEASRGRGRNAERGGRAPRGRSSQPATNGTRNKDSQLSVPTEESSAWNTASTTDGWGDPINNDAADKPVVADPPKPVIPQGKTWASMLRQSTAPKVVPKTREPLPEKSVDMLEPLPSAEPVDVEPVDAGHESVDQPIEQAEEPLTLAPTVIEPEIALPPAKDQLTETNLEQIVDESKPAATGTAASTAADSWDPRQNALSATATPLSASQQAHQAQRQPPTGPASGYAASAIKATTRSHSYQRRLLDQQEPVRMPGNREVDRAAVQFGAFNLTDADDDIDGEREEPETRAPLPDDSPIAPRAALPPPVSQPAAVPDIFSQKAPVAGIPSAVPTAPAAQVSQQSMQAQSQPLASSMQPFGRFSQSSAQDPSFPQKPFDSFNQSSTTASSQPQTDDFPTPQQPSQQQGNAFSSAPSEYSSYYTADQQSRGPYNSYYGQHYGQHQSGQAQQEGVPPSGQQRSFSGYNNTSQADNLSQYPQSGALHNQSRFGAVASEAQGSGHSTPNPPGQTQQQQQQGGQASQPQSHGQQGYQFHHPYIGNPYYQQYMNYPGSYGQGGYGGGPYGKGNMYAGPYGVSPQAPYDHPSSQSSGLGQSSLHRADSGLSSGLADYGRTGAQAGSQPGSLGAGSGFSGAHDSFGRGGSSFPSQAGQGFNNPSQTTAGASSEDLKPFGDAKATSGPSPALGGARPGSAANNPAAGQTGLPPQFSGSYGYSSHQSLHGSTYGSGQNYGSYGPGQSGFGSGYYGQQQGQQQPQQQQQQRGWGGNYH